MRNARRILAVIVYCWAYCLCLFTVPAWGEEHKALLLETEAEAVNARWDLIEGENKEIFAAIHIWDGTRVGAAALAGLREAARRGAKVRLVMDALASRFWNSSGITPGEIKALQNAGVEVRLFNPPRGVRSVVDPSLLNRMHDKLIYFGGQKIVMTGDRNFQNANFSRVFKGWRQVPGYRSIETMIQGEASERAKEYLEQLWGVSEPVDASKAKPKDVEEADRTFDYWIQFGKESNHQARRWERYLRPVESIQFVHNPFGGRGMPLGAERPLVEMVRSAQKQVIVSAPFHTLAPQFEDALLDRARAGKEVILLVPSKETSLAPATPLMFSWQAHRLRDAGVKIYAHQGPQSLHAKFIGVDGKHSFIGSHNFNMRSTETDMESGFLIVSEDYGKTLQEFSEELRNESLPYTAPQLGMGEACFAGMLRLGSKIPFIGRQL